MDAICRPVSTFWNIDGSAWDFTLCFVDTVFLSVPFLFLALASIGDFLLGQRNSYPRWVTTVKSVYYTKLALIGAIIGLGLFQLAAAVYGKSNAIASYEYLSPLILVSAMIVVGLATRMNRARKKRSSGILFLFWMLICVYGAVRLRATYLLEDSVFRSELRLALSGVQLALFGFSFIASCFSNWKPISWTDGDEDEPVSCPADSAGFLSNVTYSWMNKIIYTGFKRPLTESDLPGLSVNHTTTDIVASFRKTKSRSVVPALWSISRRLLLSATLLQLAAVPFAVLPSLFVDVLIDFSRADVDATKTPTWHGVVVAALLFVVCLANALATQRSQQCANVAGMRARAALTGIVYRKLVRLSANARRVFATGDIVNLLAADAERIMEFYPRVPQFFGAVVCTIVAVAYMGTIVGLSALYCLIALAFFLPVLVCLLGMLKRYQDSQMRIKDERLRTTTEALSGIKVVKLYAWEWAFTSRINEMRNDELQYIYRSKIVNGALVAILTSIPVFIQIVALVTYIASHHRLDAETAFVVVTLVSLVNASLINIPVALSAFAQSLTACRRLDEFLASEDVDATSVEWIERARREPGDEKIQDAVRIDDGNFKWCAYESSILQGLNLRIREGTLLAVVGRVGVGKSSLLSAMLGDMVKSSGSLTVAGSVAYVSQVPWIRNATVKENILFGNAFDSKWYRRVVKSCALEPDFDVLPARDSTEIGEKGVNLSGGQRTRISLARAVYVQADVYLLDDPLSAVDSQVGKRIFEKVIGSHGLLKNKTIILVTHCLTFMPRVDLILVLKDGGVSQLGSYSELKERGGDFAEYLEEYSQPSADTSCVTSDATIDDTSCELSRSQHWAWRSSGEVHLLPVSKKRRRRRVGVSPLVAGERSPLLATGTHETTGDETGDGNGALTDDEQLETGTVKFRVFVDYLKAGGFLSAIMFLFFVLIGMGCTTFGNVWLAEWTDASTSETKSKDYNEALYGFIYCASAIFGSLFLFVDGLFLARTARNASATIHRRLVERVFRFPLVFFDVTPLGRVVARFAKDVYIVDGILADSFQRLVAVAVASVGSLVVIALAVPAFVVVAVIVVPVYVLLQRFYVASSRQLRRLRAASRSPLFSLVGETMQGASTVRAFRRVDALVAENDRLADVQQRCFFYFTSGTRWIGVRLEFLAAVITFSVALLVVFLRGSQSAGYVGLALSSGYGFFGLMTGLLNSASLFETNLVALERLREYDEVETEGFGIIPHRRPPRDWPHRGEIEFRSYSARYRQGQPLILKNISCKIRSGEKIGIVGRTGAGKSSLTLALFRVIEASLGAILIDGVNVATIGLNDLRSNLTIIPQDPVLFSGSLRFNLDPRFLHSEAELWHVLKKARLMHTLPDLERGLDSIIPEGGSNLSVGQRQLVCLARALLRKSRILVLDEATASVDMETDEVIQETLHEEFAHCTVLTIAHRLNTIMGSDRVLVLEKSEIAEMDTVESLLAKRGLFYSLARKAGLA